MAHAHTHSGAPVDVHDITDWRAAIWAGLIAGVVFVMAEMLMVWLLMGGSPWGPPRMMAAMVMGREVLPPPADFAMVPLIAAMAVHLPLSIVYGLVIGWMVHRLDMAMAILAGIVFGLVAIYLVNFHVMTAAFPWFAEARNAVTAFAHALFGAVAAGSYVALRRPRAR